MLRHLKLSEASTAVITLIDEPASVPLRLAVLRPGRKAGDLAPRAPGSLILGARIDGQLVATLCLSPANEPDRSEAGQWRLLGMATDPNWRNRGIGGALIEAALALLGQREDAAILWCNGRIEAARFYRRHGFADDGRVVETEAGLRYRFRRLIPKA
jgi:GNAT superfamily N-acetyltransferase